MSDYNVGDRVRVEFTGAIRELDSYDECAAVQSDDSTFWHYIHLSSPGITRVEPKGWPPQKGDIWEDDQGHEWFVSHHSFAGSEGPVLTKDFDRACLGAESFKIRNPKLIRRKT